MALSELERLAMIARAGANPVYPTQNVAVTIAANRTLNQVVDDTFSTDADTDTTNARITSVSSSINTTIGTKASTVSVTAISSSFAAIIPFNSITGSCTNDAAAASAGVPVGGLYHTAGAIKVRLV